MKIDLEKVTPLVIVALNEDVGKGDVTTKSCIPKDQKAEAEIVFKQDGIICGLDVARLAFRMVEGKVIFRSMFKDGLRVRSGSVVAKIRGPAQSILIAERVALNFLSHLSGIATQTSEYVKRIRPYKVKIMDTRKTTPGLRYLEKYAVKVGGGHNHRMGLYDQVLIKDNHLSALSFQLSVLSRKTTPIREAIERVRKYRPKNKKIEIEVKNLGELKEALRARPDIIMLDNMDLGQIRKAVELVGKRAKLEVSGGVTLRNIRDIARTGVDMISIGELTHSAGSIDIALEIKESLSPIF